MLPEFWKGVLEGTIDHPDSGNGDARKFSEDASSETSPSSAQDGQDDTTAVPTDGSDSNAANGGDEADTSRNIHEGQQPGKRQDRPTDLVRVDSVTLDLGITADTASPSGTSISSRDDKSAHGRGSSFQTAPLDTLSELP